ncbi:hypothetical protein K1719_044237 [Acacia pycnantha]|nr:hypothetical protein K1719_044237 [Acacia pycnantha]
MDAGSLSSSANLKTQSHPPLKEQFVQRKNARENLDRFIPIVQPWTSISHTTCLLKGQKVRKISTRTHPQPTRSYLQKP